ncbi:alanyl-trna synthetase [Holotrichia oblita]|nr:alanyl-trna synthetase [Holotrichia oblita]
MKKLNSIELRQMWLDFFKSKKHSIIKSASLIPENDPTVLFTTAGMHPLVPYLLGQPHPGGNRLANVQKCVRTGDIDDVGDNRHCTFFEMLGNWSLGDYFKEDMIKWSYEFLTDAKYLAIPVERLAVSVFEGDSDAPKDTESAKIWQECGIKKEQIFFLKKEHNWWGPAGITGPCGPDTEMFVDTKKPKCSKDCSPACNCGKYVEIWNDVFMQYFKNADGSFTQLKNKNVDTGMGLERTLCMLNGFDSVYETDIFTPAINKIEVLSGCKYADNLQAFRVIADHIRTATFMLGDERGVVPGNIGQGYILRRLIRRAVRYGRSLNLTQGSLAVLSETFVEIYKDIYPEIYSNKDKIYAELNREEERFSKTLVAGLKEFEKIVNSLNGSKIDGATAFKLYDTYGFPIEITVELAGEKRLTVDTQGFDEAFKAHQAKSQAGRRREFQGRTGGRKRNCYKASYGHASFTSRAKKEPDELKRVEELVNQAIKDAHNITVEEMSVEEAKKAGAIGLFEHKYGELVKVYTMGDFSKEICGGPHAQNTSELISFKILKEESSSAGVRRIKAVIG